jgi:Tfp pilus assembly protein PilF
MAAQNIQHDFEMAIEHHQAGRLAQAEAGYQILLAREPGHAGATHNLGLIAQQTGKLVVAVDLLGRAVALDPQWAEAQHNFGVALRESGRLDDAIAASRRALALNGNLAEAFGNIGDALKEQGLFDEAVGAYRRGLAVRADYPEARHALGNLLHRQGKIDEAIGAFRVGVDQIWRKSATKWKWPGAGIDVEQVAREVERVATQGSKECSVAVISGEKFSGIEGVGVYLKSLARVFGGDKYILANGLFAERIREIKSLGFKIIQIPRMEAVLSGRWRIYDAFIGATRYERYLLTDSKDVLFQGNPFDFPLGEDSVVLVGEGMVHGNSVWNILDQAAFQRSIGVEVDFKDWHVINSGVEYGTREKMKELVGRVCRIMSGPMASTDQAALNYIYHISLKSDARYVLALPGAKAFCATGWSEREGTPVEGYDLKWNGEKFFSPRVGVYGIVHQWERTPFGGELLKVLGGGGAAGR